MLMPLLCLQGVGNFLNTGILLILLCIFDVTTVANQKAHPNRLGGVWRTAFGIGLIPIIAIIFYRVVYLRVRSPLAFAACTVAAPWQLHGLGLGSGACWVGVRIGNQAVHLSTVADQ